MPARRVHFRGAARRRVYSDRAMAAALQTLSESGNAAEAVRRLGVPRGTVNSWRDRYLEDDEFAERIDLALLLDEDDGVTALIPPPP